MWSRIHLIPAMQAEEDRDQVRRMLADKARERELLGAETKVYHSDRWVLFPSLPFLPSLFSSPCSPLFSLFSGLVVENAADVWITRFVRPTFAVTPAQTTK